MNKMKWSISYTTVFGTKLVESFKDRDEAQARYEDLLPRTYGVFGDLISVTAPIRSAVKISESVSPKKGNGSKQDIADMPEFEEDCGGASAASLGAVPTGVVRLAKRVRTNN